MSPRETSVRPAVLLWGGGGAGGGPGPAGQPQHHPVQQGGRTWPRVVSTSASQTGCTACWSVLGSSSSCSTARRRGRGGAGWGAACGAACSGCPPASCWSVSTRYGGDPGPGLRSGVRHHGGVEAAGGPDQVHRAARDGTVVRLSVVSPPRPSSSTTSNRPACCLLSTWPACSSPPPSPHCSSPTLFPILATKGDSGH